jgi:aspartate/methionine/tyrosine aminotransferase
METPVLSQSALTLRPSIFAELTPRIRELGERCFPLHIGDTYRLPPRRAREALRAAASLESTRFFEYTHPFGRPELLEAISAKLWADNGIRLGPDGLQVTCGATQALAAVAQACLNPGDEVIVLCPHWPLIRGIVQTVGGVVVDAPFDGAVRDPEGVLGPLLSAATKAVYFANPNNPDGRLLSVDEARALHSFASAHGLLLWSDEAYEHIVFDGHTGTSVQSLDNEAERPCVVSVFTFSKSFGMAGLRVGYIAAPKQLMVTIRRVCNHQIYNLSDMFQEAVLAALTAPRDDYLGFLTEQRRAYQDARDLLLQAFPAGPTPPGGAYLFVPCASKAAAWRTLHAWLDRGVASAPGEAFGGLHEHCLRLCFTAVPMDRLRHAVDILAEVGVLDEMA